MGNTAADIERILNLVQPSTRARQDRRRTKFCLEGTGYGRVCVGLAGARGDASVCKPLRGI